MLANPAALPLLDEYALDAFPDCPIERHVRKPRFRVCSGEQAGQLATWLHNRHGPCLLPNGRGLRASLRLIDEISQLLRELCVPLASSLGGHLHCDRIKALVVPFGVGPDECLQLVCFRHS
jgi:hypothetical protein